jgi:hypothetical protein
MVRRVPRITDLTASWSVGPGNCPPKKPDRCRLPRETGGLRPFFMPALGDGTVSIIDCQVDFSENEKVTAKLGSLFSPI